MSNISDTFDATKQNTFNTTTMEEIKKALLATGQFTKAQVDTIATAAVNIAGDYENDYESLNEFVKAKEDLMNLKASIAALSGNSVKSIAPAKAASKPRAAKLPAPPLPSESRKAKEPTGKVVNLDADKMPDDDSIDL